MPGCEKRTRTSAAGGDKQKRRPASNDEEDARRETDTELRKDRGERRRVRRGRRARELDFPAEAESKQKDAGTTRHVPEGTWLLQDKTRSGDLRTGTTQAAAEQHPVRDVRSIVFETEASSVAPEKRGGFHRELESSTPRTSQRQSEHPRARRQRSEAEGTHAKVSAATIYNAGPLLHGVPTRPLLMRKGIPAAWAPRGDWLLAGVFSLRSLHRIQIAASLKPWRKVNYLKLGSRARGVNFHGHWAKVSHRLLHWYGHPTHL
ncbi:hypothetical protein NDU88_005768 [Pleurodeles waltl]|uniref:Uncharacterized protein n=1 Tax=Pleurodeles waltl TaxID=8319 RepID=A0AAV7LT04_PLEWA|nr:hypothetical protein NDU88_005768 [Pleurodeles waltl]